MCLLTPRAVPVSLMFVKGEQKAVRLVALTFYLVKHEFSTSQSQFSSSGSAPLGRRKTENFAVMLKGLLVH